MKKFFSTPLASLLILPLLFAIPIQLSFPVMVHNNLREFISYISLVLVVGFVFCVAYILASIIIFLLNKWKKGKKTSVKRLLMTGVLGALVIIILFFVLNLAASFYLSSLYTLGSTTLPKIENNY